jgi:lactate dehydrogenase-like 2-hydroxyacid dehydrogenase
VVSDHQLRSQRLLFISLKTYRRNSGAGYDQVDVKACAKRGIQLSNTPNVVNDSTADTAMFLILGALRRLNVPMRTLREGAWRGTRQPPLGHDPEGKTLGILGMGGIGQNLSRKAEAFGMRVIYHNRCRLDKDRAGSAEYVTLEDLLEKSDVVSVNLPLNVSDPFKASRRSCISGMLHPEAARHAMTLTLVKGRNKAHHFHARVLADERRRGPCQHRTGRSHGRGGSSKSIGQRQSRFRWTGRF